MSFNSSGAAITVERLSKQYRIGHSNQETMLRERLASLARSVIHRNQPREEDILWALRDVSFSVERGEVIGIVGRNGAGKSTLLKILSRITYPTSGTIRVNGRVASLLEVGTGFHEELTGRENIYLNGSILGMSKKEVERKMDAIVEFSGVERFLDTPIKRYSSGMRLRLGFAVAAHLDPDLLIVDEVLAVGDAAFQKKCLNVMQDLRGGGRTVLFVSHNLAAVENLCSRCIWIDAGEVRMDGESREVIQAYMGMMAGADNCALDLENVENRRGNGEVRYRGLEFLSLEGEPQKLIRAGDPVILRFHYHAEKPVPYPSFGFRLYTELGHAGDRYQHLAPWPRHSVDRSRRWLSRPRNRLPEPVAGPLQPGALADRDQRSRARCGGEWRDARSRDGQHFRFGKNHRQPLRHRVFPAEVGPSQTSRRGYAACRGRTGYEPLIMTSASQPRVSILTPVYNGGEFLAECIESVLAQTHTNWDYTIVNNCSTDNTLEVAERYAAADPRIRIHNNETFLRAIPNHSVAFGLISAESKYAKMVFSDDWLYPECVERMVEVAESYPSVGIVGAYGLRGTEVMWTGLPYPSTVISGRDICRRLLIEHLHVFGTATSHMIRSDLVRARNSFYNESNLHADMEVCVELLKTCDFGFVHQVLTFTREREESLTTLTRTLNTLGPRVFA